MTSVHSEAEMTDAIEVLSDDHRRMRGLFDEFEALPATAYVRKSKVAAQMIDLMTVHVFIRREVLYPRITSLLPDAEDEIEIFLAAHRRAERAAVALWTMRPEDERFADNAAELIELLRDHLDAQDLDWFPRLNRMLDGPALDAIGNELVRARHRAPASPWVGS